MWCPSAAAVLALVLGVLALALAGGLRAAADPAPAPRAAAADAARPGAASVARPAFAPAGVLPERAPSCAPGSDGLGTAPAVPPRAGQEHASVPAARPAPEGVRPYRAVCVRVPVRGPAPRAPGPVELSVMRV